MAEINSRRRGPTLRASSLTVRLKPKPLNKYEVWLEDGATDREDLLCQGEASDIENKFLPDFRGDLEKICDQVGGGLDKKDSIARVAEGLKTLRMVGQVLLLDLLGADGARKFWALVNRRQIHTHLPLRLEFQSPMKWPIPFDILPLRSPAQASLPSNKAELMAFAKIFPAFSAVTRHIPMEGHLSSEKEIPCHPWLTLLYMHHDGAPGSERAYGTLTALKDLIVLDGPFPQSAEHDSDYLARLLAEQGWRSAHVEGGISSRIVHIHAHALTGEPSVAEAHQLRFAYRTRGWFRGSRHPVIVSNGHLATATDPTGIPVEYGPFIFVNACGGAAPSFRGGLGLAGFFLKHGYRAFAGPVVSIYGEVAAEMADRFYKHLFRGFELAEALFLARRDLLEEWHNPLGALYAIHGESGLYIDK